MGNLFLVLVVRGDRGRLRGRLFLLVAVVLSRRARRGVRVVFLLALALARFGLLRTWVNSRARDWVRRLLRHLNVDLADQGHRLGLRR